MDCFCLKNTSFRRLCQVLSLKHNVRDELYPDLGGIIPDKIETYNLNGILWILSSQVKV